MIPNRSGFLNRRVLAAGMAAIAGLSATGASATGRDDDDDDDHDDDDFECPDGCVCDDEGNVYQQTVVYVAGQQQTVYVTQDCRCRRGKKKGKRGKKR